MTYLDPWDLLYLSRASKGFREILVTQKAAGIWKRSIQSVDLPPCPDDITEPAYIAFVFDSDYCVCAFFLSNLRLRLTSPFSGMRKFTRAPAGPTTQDETLCQVQVERVGTAASRYSLACNIFASSVQWFNARAVGRLVTPSTLQVIATDLVTPCQCSQRPRRSRRLTYRSKSP